MMNRCIFSARRDDEIYEICLLWKLVSKLSLVEERIDEGKI